MAEYKSVVDQILADLSSSSGQILAQDTALLNASSKESGEYGLQYERRDGLYADLLEAYIDVYNSKAAWNKWFKLAFFAISLLIFGGIVVVSLIVLITIARKNTTSLSDVAVALSSMAGIISAIIILPKIIAEHLFPTNEDEHMIEMVKNMQVNDSRIRSHHKDKEVKVE